MENAKAMRREGVGTGVSLERARRSWLENGVFDGLKKTRCCDDGVATAEGRRWNGGGAEWQRKGPVGVRVGLYDLLG